MHQGSRVLIERYGLTRIFVLMRGAARLGRDWRDYVPVASPAEEEAMVMAFDRVMSDLEERRG